MMPFLKLDDMRFCTIVRQCFVNVSFVWFYEILYHGTVMFCKCLFPMVLCDSVPWQGNVL